MTDTAAAINATNLGCSITCKDLQASIRFYRDGIGFAVGETYENEGKVVAAVVSAGDCRIVLNQDDGKLAGTGSRGRASICRSTWRPQRTSTRRPRGSRPRAGS